MRDNNEQFKWLKLFLQLFVFTTLSCRVYADNSTEAITSVDNSTEAIVAVDNFSDDIFAADNSTDEFLAELASDYHQEPLEPIPMLQCGLNEAPQYCEIDCIDCEQRGFCEAQNCDVLHCDCRMNFVHMTRGGPCEHISKCPARECPENEVYRHCGPFCERCDTPDCREMECSSRCYCKAGHRRHTETGKCVPANECPERLTCISNDDVQKSGPAVEYCVISESEALRVNETIEEEKCYCKEGFKRNIHGWCIDEEYCEFIGCFGITVHQDCPRKCNTSCWNYGDPNCEEDGQCYPACFCPENYVLNEQLECIPFEMCPPGSNPFAAPLPPPPVAPIPQPILEDTGNSTGVAKEEAAENGPTETGGSSITEASNSEAAVSESPPEVVEPVESEKEAEPEVMTPEVTTTAAPKKPPKKVSKSGKGTKSYKLTKGSSSKSSSSSAVPPPEEDENE